MTLLTWWHQVPFGKSDPVLGYDAAFYVFTLPALELARGLALGLVLLAAAGVAALYFAAGQVALTPFGLRIDDRARRHLSWLAAALLPRARARRLARPAAGDRLAVRHHPGRQLRRRARAACRPRWR